MWVTRLEDKAILESNLKKFSVNPLIQSSTELQNFKRREKQNSVIWVLALGAILILILMLVQLQGIRKNKFRSK